MELWIARDEIPNTNGTHPIALFFKEPIESTCFPGMFVPQDDWYMELPESLANEFDLKPGEILQLNIERVNKSHARDNRKPEPVCESQSRNGELSPGGA